MERDYPIITAWTRHETVSVEALRAELAKALAFLDDPASATEDQPSACKVCGGAFDSTVHLGISAHGHRYTPTSGICSECNRYTGHHPTCPLAPGVNRD